MSKVLVAYFSASGVTKKVAVKLAEAIGRKATGFVQSGTGRTFSGLR